MSWNDCPNAVILKLEWACQNRLEVLLAKSLQSYPWSFRFCRFGGPQNSQKPENLHF